ncbi:MAG TPA: phytanoyl-CoA dioxygenase family protein [Solirubrobacterales bacterium]|jgi:hypothetical protein|nr:phytanoyl-CoA dioxygenase family protein [Solirubrobacterales bacterium]
MRRAKSLKAALSGRQPDPVGRSTDELRAEIDELTRANRDHRDPDTERRLMELRHLVGIRQLGAGGGEPAFPEPAFDRLPDRNGDLAGVPPGDLTPELVRAGILRDGCLLIRGLMDPDEARALAKEIDQAFDARDAVIAGGVGSSGYYDEFVPDARFQETLGRDWVEGGGGLWAADSPRVMFRMLDAFERAGLRSVIWDYLGEPPSISVQKCTLRRVDPDAGAGWHQDGAFLGDVRALNVWLSLSRCGDEAPGMDIVPQRLDHIVETGTDGALFEWSVSPQMAEQAAGDAGILRPIFEPGDVLLFDELFLHSTAAEPDMPKSRWAIESWFFGSSAFPGQYAPLGV